MVVREGGDVPGDSGAGLEDGRQIGPIQAGGLLSSAVMGENGGGGMECTERVCVGVVGEEVCKAGAETIGSEVVMAGVLGLLTTVEVTYQDWGDGGVEVGAEAEEEEISVKSICGRSMNVDKTEAAYSYKLCKSWPQLLGGGTRQATKDSEDAVLAMLG